MQIEKPTVLNLMKTIPSGIGLDVAKRHTGICIWNGESIELYGWELPDTDKKDYFWEYKMRRAFKQKLSEVVQGRHFEYAVIEDVYGGENFDTVRKLLALNTVIDELIFERVCTIGEFFRWGESTWMKATRALYKQKGKLKSKVETQGLLEYLEFDFLLENKDLPETRKKEIYFEDKCDATAMLLGVIAHKKMELNLAKSSSLKFSDIKMQYIEDLSDIFNIRDDKARTEGYIEVDLDYRHLEESILDQAKMYPGDVLIAELPVSKLGAFGMKHQFTYFRSNQGYLLWYKK